MIKKLVITLLISSLCGCGLFSSDSSSTTQDYYKPNYTPNFTPSYKSNYGITPKS